MLRVASDGGRDHRVCPSGQLLPASSWAAPANKVLTRHGPPASMGVWSLELLLDKWTDNTTPGESKRIKKLPALRIANWNVRTMCTGLTDDLQSINNACKTAIIDTELDMLNTDIACLQEATLADSGSLKEQRSIHVLLVGEESRRKA